MSDCGSSTKQERLDMRRLLRKGLLQESMLVFERYISHHLSSLAQMDTLVL
jgi:hypothetical protein